MLRNRAANEDLDADGRANVELRSKLLMAHAKYRGWLIERKQIARASIDLGRVSTEDMTAHVGQYLDALDPGARGDIEERVARLAARRRSVPGS